MPRRRKATQSVSSGSAGLISDSINRKFTRVIKRPAGETNACFLEQPPMMLAVTDQRDETRQQGMLASLFLREHR